MGSLFGNIARGIGGAVMTVSRSPIAKLIPYVGTASAVLGAGSALLGGGGGAPALPPMPGMPAGGGFAPPATMGDRSIFRNDPNTIAAIKPYAISMHNLKQMYRAPKGFIIVRDEKGDPMGVPKFIAKMYFGWKPAKKPLLSIRDTNAIRHAGTAIKKLQRAEKMAKKIANWHSPRPRGKQIFVTGGVVGKKRIA